MATAASTSKLLGTLVVVVIRAKNLRDKHTFTKQDPFVTVQLGKEKKSTEIDKRGGQHPVWDVDLHLPVSLSSSKDARTLKVSCFAKEPKEDDLVGEGEVDITQTLETGEFDDWVTLKDGDAYRGEVYLEMTFFNASNKRPHSRRKPKMPQSERLQYQGLPPSNPNQPRPAANGDSKLPSSPPRRSDALPANLKPGYGSANSNASATPPAGQGSSTLAPHKPQHVPSILRPGNAKSSPTPIPKNPQPQPSSSLANVSYPSYQAEEPSLPLPFPGESSHHPPAHNPNVGPTLPPRNNPPFSSSAYPPRSNQINNTAPYPNGSNNTYSANDDDYASQERQALARASQEEADEELARIMAQNEGIDLERLRAEEADREIARKLANELNADVLERERSTQASRQGGTAGRPMPGGW